MKNLMQTADGHLRIVGPFLFSAYDCSLTVAAESTDNVDVTFQLLDSTGVALKVPNVLILFYVTLNTAGDYAAGTAVTTLTIPTAANLISITVAGQVVLGKTDANGQILVRGTIAGAATRRLAAVLPDGPIAQSGTMTWT
jgi:hypothetical protein